jgi:hypothetical protein
VTANPEQSVLDAPDVRAWLQHVPDAQPWQVDLIAAAIGAHRAGRAVSFQFSRRYGRAHTRSLIDRFLTEVESPCGDSSSTP